MNGDQLIVDKSNSGNAELIANKVQQTGQQSMGINQNFQTRNTKIGLKLPQISFQLQKNYQLPSPQPNSNPTCVNRDKISNFINEQLVHSPSKKPSPLKRRADRILCLRGLKESNNSLLDGIVNKKEIREKLLHQSSSPTGTPLLYPIHPNEIRHDDQKLFLMKYNSVQSTQNIVVNHLQQHQEPENYQLINEKLKKDKNQKVKNLFDQSHLLDQLAMSNYENMRKVKVLVNNNINLSGKNRSENQRYKNEDGQTLPQQINQEYDYPQIREKIVALSSEYKYKSSGGQNPTVSMVYKDYNQFYQNYVKGQSQLANAETPSTLNTMTHQQKNQKTMNIAAKSLNENQEEYGKDFQSNLRNFINLSARNEVNPGNLYIASNSVDKRERGKLNSYVEGDYLINQNYSIDTVDSSSINHSQRMPLQRQNFQIQQMLSMSQLSDKNFNNVNKNFAPTTTPNQLASGKNQFQSDQGFQQRCEFNHFIDSYLNGINAMPKQNNNDRNQLNSLVLSLDGETDRNYMSNQQKCQSQNKGDPTTNITLMKDRPIIDTIQNFQQHSNRYNNNNVNSSLGPQIIASDWVSLQSKKNKSKKGSSRFSNYQQGQDGGSGLGEQKQNRFFLFVENPLNNTMLNTNKIVYRKKKFQTPPNLNIEKIKEKKRESILLRTRAEQKKLNENSLNNSIQVNHIHQIDLEELRQTHNQHLYDDLKKYYNEKYEYQILRNIEDEGQKNQYKSFIPIGKNAMLSDREKATYSNTHQTSQFQLEDFQPWAEDPQI